MKPTSSKPCSKCGEVRELDDFARDASKGDGRKGVCKICDAAKAKRYYAAHREKAIARASKRYYETTADVPDSLRRQRFRPVAE